MTNFNCVCPSFCLFISSFVFLYLCPCFSFCLFSSKLLSLHLQNMLDRIVHHFFFFDLFTKSSTTSYMVWVVFVKCNERLDKQPGQAVKTNIGTKCPINSKRIDQYSQNLSILDHIENISIVAKIFSDENIKYPAELTFLFSKIQNALIKCFFFLFFVLNLQNE